MQWYTNKLVTGENQVWKMLNFKGIIFLILLWTFDAGVLVLLIWTETKCIELKVPEIYILIALPWAIIFTIHFLGFYLMYDLFLEIKLVASTKIKVMAMLGMQTLILQLTVSLYFAYLFHILSGYNIYYGALICAVYPVFIGAVKFLEK